MISSAVAFQTKGLGSAFHCPAQTVMASVRSATLVKRPRRSRLSVNSLNHRSTRFSQETGHRRAGASGGDPCAPATGSPPVHCARTGCPLGPWVGELRWADVQGGEQAGVLFHVDALR